MQRKASIFREEALEYHRRGPRGQGDVLRIAPTWARWAYWVLVGALASGLLFSILGRVNEYASGSALVRVEGHTHLTAPVEGVVASVPVQPGQRVQAGQPLVTFVSQGEQDSDARTLKAPFAGVIEDVVIQPGQYLARGARVLSLTGNAAPVVLQVFLPGHYRPLLRPGMPLRLELDGFRHLYLQSSIDSVGDQIIGPHELRRYLGAELADSVRVAGPVVLVTARLPSRTFESEGSSFNYFDGMPARADVPVRSEPVLLQLIPGLRGSTPHAH